MVDFQPTDAQISLQRGKMVRLFQWLAGIVKMPDAREDDGPVTLRPNQGRLKAIGYWHGPMVAELFHPQALVDPTWERARRLEISSYLRRGICARKWMGYASCRFGCPIGIGTKCLTDGEWIWPEGLSHYIDEHSIRLPNEFVASALDMQFNHGLDQNQADSGFDDDFDFWFRWCRENMGVFVPEAKCWVCQRTAKAEEASAVQPA